jgi:hypothetical protein
LHQVLPQSISERQQGLQIAAKEAAQRKRRELREPRHNVQSRRRAFRVN